MKRTIYYGDEVFTVKVKSSKPSGEWAAVLIFVVGFALFMGGAYLDYRKSQQYVITAPQVRSAPDGWTLEQWQSVINCTYEPGNGGDWSCDSCYIARAMQFGIEIDTLVLDYY